MRAALRLAVLAAASAPVSALAHSGAHDHVEGGLLAHMLESPFHLAIVVLALGFAVYGVSQVILPVVQKARRDKG